MNDKSLASNALGSVKELEEVDSVSVEETLIDGDAKVPEVDHLSRSNVDVVDVNFALAVSLHSESVKDALGGMLDTEDKNFVNDLGGGRGVHVLVANGLGD